MFSIIFLRRVFSAFVLGCLLLFNAPIAQAAEIPPDLEQQIIQVIQGHPKVILDTLIDYQQQSEQATIAKKQENLEAFRKSPKSLIAQSPTSKTHLAKTVVVEFSDFQCPFCQEAYHSLNSFHTKHPDVLIAYKHFPLVQIHDQAMPAAQAAWAAQQQGKFWDYHNQLFEHQDALDEGLYKQIAQELGLDLRRFDRDRNSAAATQAITDDLKLADVIGVEGTPLFVILGQKSAKVISGADIDNLESALAQVS
jgi:protein-disulfide isomerase